jgi:hypothetical protein
MKSTFTQNDTCVKAGHVVLMLKDIRIVKVHLSLGFVIITNDNTALGLITA